MLILLPWYDNQALFRLVLPLGKFDNVVIRAIAEQCDSREAAVNLALVNRRFYHAVAPVLFRKLLCRETNGNRRRLNLDEKINFACKQRHAHLKGTVRFLDLVVPDMPTIKALGLYAVGESGTRTASPNVLDILDACKNVEVLKMEVDLRGDTLINHDALRVVSRAQDRRPLKVLHISPRGHGSGNIRHANTWKREGLQGFLRMFPNIRALGIDGSFEVHDLTFILDDIVGCTNGLIEDLIISDTCVKDISSRLRVTPFMDRALLAPIFFDRLPLTDLSFTCERRQSAVTFQRHHGRVQTTDTCFGRPHPSYCNYTPGRYGRPYQGRMANSESRQDLVRTFWEDHWLRLIKEYV